jgi:uncharacterized membrane protein YgcG
MKALVRSLALFLILGVIPVAARPADDGATAQVQLPAGDAQAVPVEPSSPEPTITPPAPPAELPEPPPAQDMAMAQQAAQGGQWVYTAQYGWLWMPYGNAYVYQPLDGSTPNMYAYYPAVGWSWMVAPWVWGLGPMPYFGILGPWYFGWYGGGYGHWYGYAPRYGYAGWYGRGYWQGGRWYGYPGGRGVHPAPPRPAYAAPPRAGYPAPPRPAYAAPRPGYGAPPRTGHVAPAPPRGGFGGGGVGHGGGGSGGGGRGGGGHGGGGHGGRR